MKTQSLQTKKIGILGGGQLGRMMLSPAHRLDLNIAVMDADTNAPCRPWVHDFTVGNLNDKEAVFEWGKSKDFITIEIENVSVEALRKLEEHGVTVYPQPNVIALVQDKVKQKQFYRRHGISTADFVEVKGKDEMLQYQDRLPMVNKLAREGYDGRGVAVIKNLEDIEKGFDEFGLLEDFIPFKKELSVLIARTPSGATKCYPLVEMIFQPEHHLVDYLFSPAEVSKDIVLKAQRLAQEVITKLDMVGLLAVEMFLTEDNQLLVNEVAPRTHNSGHHTIEGNITSQFEQIFRAILDVPLGETDTLQPAAMINLLGSEGYRGDVRYEGLEDVLAIPQAYVHLYGKKETKPFRKMGHVTVLDKDMPSLKLKVEKIRQLIKVIS